MSIKLIFWGRNIHNINIIGLKIQSMDISIRHIRFFLLYISYKTTFKKKKYILKLSLGRFVWNLFQDMQNSLNFICLSDSNFCSIRTTRYLDISVLNICDISVLGTRHNGTSKEIIIWLNLKTYFVFFFLHLDVVYTYFYVFFLIIFY